MFTSPLKMAGAFVALLASVNLASADPGKGLRWSDFAWGPSRTPTTRTAPTYYYAPAQNVVTGPAVAVGQPLNGNPSTAANTITIVGSDGVARTYPVVGGVVQQVPTQSTIAAPNATGVTQTAPTVGGTSTNPAVVIPATGSRVPLFPRLRR
ncbi:MAG: hypothetical protein K8U57_12930 [Planctomycetes bacterium]|nr:hypothetical protein [Planctomycetota bacterium]